MPNTKWLNQLHYITILDNWYHDWYRSDPMVPRRDVLSQHIPMSLWVGTSPLWLDVSMTAYNFLERGVIPVVEAYNRIWNERHPDSRVRKRAQWEVFQVGTRRNKSNYIGFRVIVTRDCYASLLSGIKRLTNDNPDVILDFDTSLSFLDSVVGA